MAETKKMKRKTPAAMLTFLVVWYAILFFAGGFLVYELYLPEGPFDVNLRNTVIICGSVALMASSIFYIRKMYKDVFEVHTNESISGSTEETLALLSYYLTRPVFAVFFSFITVVATYAFIYSEVSGTIILSEGFLHLNLLVSAFGGVVTGKAISRLEEIGTSRVGSAQL